MVFAMENLGVNEGILLKWPLKNKEGGCGLD
jgi:hypothetical protein